MRLKTTARLMMLITYFVAASNVYAQANGDMEALVEDTKSDFLTVVAGGLGGAILGLSTLSFVDEPKNHTKNIIMGASLGIIAGVVLVAMRQADKSQEMFYKGGQGAQNDNQSSEKFDSYSRAKWHQQENSKYSAVSEIPLSLNYSFSF